MESLIKESPSYFREIVCILKSEPFLSTLADGLVQNYIKKLKMTSSSELIQNVRYVAKKNLRTMRKPFAKLRSIAMEYGCTKQRLGF